jgi:DNA-binding MarR family transcriptional regulator
MSTRLSERERRLFATFLRTHHVVVSQLNAQLEREHGISMACYEVLLFLAMAPQHRMRMTDLARSVLLSPSGLTRLVDRQVRDGLVERVPCATDARSLYATLTPLGLERFRAAGRTHARGIQEYFLSRLDGDHQDSLLCNLEALLS